MQLPKRAYLCRKYQLLAPMPKARDCPAMPTPVPGRWLEALLDGRPVRAVPTLNRGPQMPELPPFLVVHYTAGRNAANTVKRFVDPSSQVSAHFVVAESGDVTQMVGCDRKAWHAGESTILAPSGVRYRGLNGHSIGVELDYDGWLRDLRSGRRARTQIEVIETPGRLWPLYDQRQIDALVELIGTLKQKGFLTDPCYLVGHSDIAPWRKLDPGPAFPWAEVVSRTRTIKLPLTAPSV